MKFPGSILLVALLWIAFPKIQAQNWNPLPSGQTLLHRYLSLQNGRTGFVAVKSDSLIVEGVDSVYYPFRMDAQAPPGTYVGCNSQTIYPGFLTGKEHFLGRKIVRKPSGDVLFISGGSDTLVLKTLSILGESWDWNDSITATVFDLTTAPVLGQMDSLKHVSLSSGDTIVLGKHSGLVRMFSFFSPPSPELAGRPMFLWGVPERGLGGSFPGIGKVFGFDVGDEFGKYDDYISSPFGGYREEWNTHYRVDSIYASGGNPSYNVWIEQNKKITSQQQGNSQQYIAPHADTLSFDSANYAYLNLLPYQSRVIDYPEGYYNMIQTGAYQWSLDTNRIVQRFQFGFLLDTCVGAFYSDGLIYNGWAEYVSGIGLWQWQEYGFDWSEVRATTCFHTQAGDYETCPPFNTLAAPDPTAETDGFDVFPNPASSTLRLLWKGESGNRHVTLLRSDGTVVHEMFCSKGSGDSAFDVSSLSAGLYLLKVEENGKRSMVKRVVIER